MRAALILLAALTLAGSAAAGVELRDVQAPSETRAGDPFAARATLVNGDAHPRVVYLFAALYDAGDGSCGPATDPRFRTYTPLLQARVELAARETRAYPPPGEVWLHRYAAQDVPPTRATMEWCVFAAEDAQPSSAQLRYLDFASLTLSTRRVNAPPSADFSWSPDAPRASADVRFLAEASDADGDELRYRWDFGHFDATGRAVGQGSVVTRFFYPEGAYDVTLFVSDGFEEARVAKRVTVVSESAPAPEATPTTARTPLPAWVTLGAATLAWAAARWR